MVFPHVFAKVAQPNVGAWFFLLPTKCPQNGGFCLSGRFLQSSGDFLYREPFYLGFNCLGL